MTRRVLVLVAAFAGVVIGGTTAWWGFPPVALATTGQCNGYWVTDATQATGFDFTDRGARASGEDHVYGGGVQCADAASVAVEDPSGNNFVEAGWTTMQPADPVCPDAGKINVPVVFYAYQIGGAFHCFVKLTVSISGGDNPTVSVRSDIGNNQPYSWIFTLSNGTGNGFTTELAGMGLKQGVSLSNSDRHYKNPSDPTKESAYAHFTGMQFRTSANAWQDWPDEICASTLGNPDPTYNNQLTQPNEVQVSPNQPSC